MFFIVNIQKSRLFCNKIPDSDKTIKIGNLKQIIVIQNYFLGNSLIPIL